MLSARITTSAGRPPPVPPPFCYFTRRRFGMLIAPPSLFLSSLWWSEEGKEFNLAAPLSPSNMISRREKVPSHSACHFPLHSTRLNRLRDLLHTDCSWKLLCCRSFFLCPSFFVILLNSPFKRVLHCVAVPIAPIEVFPFIIQINLLLTQNNCLMLGNAGLIHRQCWWSSI